MLFCLPVHDIKLELSLHSEHLLHRRIHNDKSKNKQRTTNTKYRRFWIFKYFCLLRIQYLSETLIYKFSLERTKSVQHALLSGSSYGLGQSHSFHNSHFDNILCALLSPS